MPEASPFSRDEHFSVLSWQFQPLTICQRFAATLSRDLIEEDEPGQWKGGD